MLAVLASLLTVLVVFLAAASAVPVLVLVVEMVAAILPWRQRPPPRGDSCAARIAVLVPAHDESAGVRSAIKDIARQLSPRDRLVVVADNCADDTAAVAAAAGAEVIARHDPTRIGKGYALAYGIRHLHADPPDVVIMIDADCGLKDGAIGRLVAECLATGRPVQALISMTAPARSRVNHQVAEFAWRVKNWVRPLGLKRLGLPCQLMGMGMAFPWRLIRAANLAGGSIVEDLQLGLDLALAGSAPRFCPQAVVITSFPVSREGAATQHQRWEHGHVHTIITLAPKLFWLAMLRRDMMLAALVLDLAVPPLAMLMLILAAVLLVAGAAALAGGSSLALLMAAINLVGFVSAIVLAWLSHGLDLLRPGAMRSVAGYVLAKLAIYRGLLTRGAITTWIRTDRSS